MAAINNPQMTRQARETLMNSGMSSENAQFHQLLQSSQQCIHLVRGIRSKLLATHSLISNGFESEAELEHFRCMLEKRSKELTDDYERIENEARTLPSHTPATVMVKRLHAFLIEVYSSNNIDPYYDTRDAFDWNDITGQYVNYVYDFLKPSSLSHRSRKYLLSRNLNDRVQPFQLSHNLVHDNPQRRFEAAFHSQIQNQENVKMRYVYRYLERSTIKLLSHFTNRENMTVDKQPVCLLKLALLVNNGVFEHIKFIAPHEDWSYLETSPKQIDLSRDSKYELYRRLDIHGGVVLNLCLSQSSCDKNSIVLLLLSIGNFHILNMPCRHCKKLIKDFSPATAGENRKAVYHQTCR